MRVAAANFSLFIFHFYLFFVPLSSVMKMVSPPTYRNDTVLPLPMEVKADAWAVDAACSGNPGPMEYQAIDLATGYRVFHF